MAVPTEQDFLDLKNAVHQLQQAQADKWIKDFWLIVAGAVTGAIPTFFLAVLNNRWNKRTFSLTKDKEQQMFKLQESKELNLVKAKLFGEIKSLERDVLRCAALHAKPFIIYRHLHSIYDKSTEAERKNIHPELSKRKEPAESTMIDLHNKIGEYAKALSEYNYFVRDPEIDKHILQIEQHNFSLNLPFNRMTVEELKNPTFTAGLVLGQAEIMDEFRVKVEALSTRIFTHKL